MLFEPILCGLLKNVSEVLTLERAMGCSIDEESFKRRVVFENFAVGLDE